MTFNNISQPPKRSQTLSPQQYNQPLIIQKRRTEFPSSQPQQRNHDISFGGLPNFTSFIDNRSLTKRSSSIHTLNVSNPNEFDDDLPPLRSQDDENFELFNKDTKIGNVRKYHNYSNSNGYNSNNIISNSNRNIRNVKLPTLINKIAPQRKPSTTIFNKKKNLDEILINPPSATSSQHIPITSDPEEDQWLKTLKTVCVGTFKISVLILSLIYQVCIKVREYLTDNEVERISETDEQNTPTVIGLDIDQSTSVEDTPLANKTKRSKDNSFNISSLNWGMKHKPVVKQKDDDYGTHFIIDNADEDEEPNVELEYIRKIFNNDGRFELQLHNAIEPQQRDNINNTTIRKSSLSNFFNLTQTFREAIGADEDEDDDVKFLQATKMETNVRPTMISKFDISKYDKLNEESLLLFEEEFKTYQSIIEEKRRRQELIKILKAQTESKVKELDSTQLLVVNNYLQSSELNLSVKKINGIELRVKDLKTLENSRWLNDNIIDSYLGLITKRSQTLELPSSFSFTTHFYTTLLEKGYKSVQRWAKRQKIDVTKLDYIFIPINSMNTHWSLLVINNKNAKFQYFDSLSFEPPDENDEDDKERFDFYRRKNLKILNNLINYMQEEDKRLHGSQTIDFQQYKLFPVMKSPQQKNGSDCGVFTCTAVEYLSRDEFLNFTQADMEKLRMKMCYEILTESLL